MHENLNRLDCDSRRSVRRIQSQAHDAISKIQLPCLHNVHAVSEKLAVGTHDYWSVGNVSEGFYS